MLDLVAIFPDKIFQLLFSIAQMYYMQYLKPNMQYFEYQAEFSVCMSHYISKRSLLRPNMFKDLLCWGLRQLLIIIFLGGHKKVSNFFWRCINMILNRVLVQVTPDTYLTRISKLLSNERVKFLIKKYLQDLVIIGV